MNMVSTTYKNVTGTAPSLFSALVADTMTVSVSTISIIIIIRIIGIIILSLIIGILLSGRIILL